MITAPGDIRILEIRTLRGPNRWTYPQILEALVDIGDLEDYPSNLLPGFGARLKAWLPALVEHRCSYGERGGFLRRLDEGTWPCHIMEHVTLELLTLAGMPGGFGKAREISQRGVYKVIVSAYQEDVSKAALEYARQLMLAAIEDRPFDVSGTVAALRRLVDRLWLGPSTGCIVAAAEQRRIPVNRLNDGNLVQLGHGTAQRRIWTAETNRTSAIAEGISRDKDLTKQLLASVGIPVPEGELVHDVAEARAAAEALGFPVVVKPYDGNHGRGVFTNLTTDDEVAAAYAVAREEGSGVLVEQFIRGYEHRLLVVGGRLVAAARGDLAWVVGDGQHTIAQLIDLQINSDPVRGQTEDSTLNIVRLDAAARLELARAGLHAESVLMDGQRVLIQRNGNVAIDCTDQVHPDTAQLAALAARVVGLDIAGIDLVVEDIAHALGPQGGAIVEVNAGPGLLMHLRPAQGAARPVGQAIIDHLFPPDDSGRIPLVGISGHAHTAAVSQWVARLLHGHFTKLGVANEAGVWVGERPLALRTGSAWDAAHSLLLNPMVDAAVIATTPAQMAAEGLAYDRCSVGIVTSLDPNADLPDLHILGEQALYGVVRTQIDVVLPSGTGILNAEDPRVLEMAGLCDGHVMLYARDETHGALVAHRQTGLRAVFARGADLILADAREETVLAGALEQGPAEALLPAVAAVWALGIPPRLIEHALSTPRPVLAA